MLDDLALLSRFDSDNALAIAAAQNQQLLFSQDKADLPDLKNIKNIVLTGMGGSALAGLLVRSWLEDKLRIPFIITRNYSLPAFVDSSTLVIVSSYSGNTEETLSALNQANNSRAKVIVISSGGKLLKLATKEKLPYFQLPKGYQPRMAVWFSVRVLAEIFETAGFAKSAVTELLQAQKGLEKAVYKLLPQISTEGNLAKQIAQDIAGKSIVVYGSPLLGSAAYKWKISINESSKNLAFYNEFPEFNHNEFIGWSSHPTEKVFTVIELTSGFDSDKIKKRFQVSNQLLSGKMPKPIEVKAQGSTKIEQILYTVQLGDFVSIYLAVLNGVNPTPVELVEKLKKRL